MVRVNKYETSIFGLGPIGNAIFMVTFMTPGVPPEWWNDYWKTINFPRWLGSVGKRYPFRIIQPATPAQKFVWNIFLKAIQCWHKQPESGGVEPPDIGPRNRSWWYAHDPPVPPIYFNFFMRETLTNLHAGITSPWCKDLVAGDTYVDSEYPDDPHGGLPFMRVGIVFPVDPTMVARVYIKTPGNYLKDLYLWVSGFFWFGAPLRPIEVWTVDPSLWDEYTLTWNNQPALVHYMETIEPIASAGIWVKIFIGSAKAVCLKFADESPLPEFHYYYLHFSTREGADPEKHPYTLISPPL